jgi:hypothetical protein
MNKLFSPFFIILLTATFLSSQDFQVTNMQGYVVENPKFSIANGNAYLTFATNTKLYKFPATGPQSPISNPINFDPNFWGPAAVDIAAYGNYIYTIAYDFNSTVWVTKIGLSTNGGMDWVNYIIDTVTISNWIPLRADLPRVIVSDQGVPYFFYYVFENERDTSGLYLYSFGTPKRKVDVNIPRVRNEDGIAPFVVTRNNVDHLYVAYYIDSSFYYVHSTDLGQTFSQPQKIQSFWVMWPPDEWRARFQVDNSGKMYFYYYYQDFGQPGQPPEDKMYHLVTYSTDWGVSWSAPILIDTNFYDIDFRVVGNKFVKSYFDFRDLYLQSSSDLLNWTERIRVNTVDTSVVGGGFETEIYDNKLAFAWKDNRTGHDEIFYRLMEIPTKVDENSIPLNFTLYQNYPNPFNPTTIISFVIKQKAKTSLRVYDIFGKFVGEIVNDELDAGKYSYEFNGSNLSSGVYYYQLSSGNFKETKKMILIK